MKKPDTIKDFDLFRFKGLEPKIASNKYLHMNRVSADKSKIVVRFGTAHIFRTEYGFGFIVGQNHIVWLKNWQVDFNWYADAFDACEIVLDKQFYNPKEANKPFDEISVDNELGYYTWDELVEIAEEQDKAQDGVKWTR